MTDRDTFAAAALTGLLAGRSVPYSINVASSFVESAWALADAMLAARGEALRPADAAYTQGVSASDESKNHDAAPPAGSVTLTDAERRELDAAASEYENGAEQIVYGRHAYRRRAATLRGLLARATKEGR
jgi:hypothetical protein